MKIIKNNHSFYVTGEYSQNWFRNNKLDTWEQDTFHILDNYKNENGVYLDIGAWIGPTVLYACKNFGKVIAMEPDPIALYELENNVKINNFTNITVIKKALSDKNGISKFGGNGPLGNSESTLLVANDDYADWEIKTHWSPQERKSNIIEIDTITIEKLLDEQNITPDDISLIKMDIEGGELIVVPYLHNFLDKYKPVFYISLHYVFLQKSHISLILDTLFDIYKNCYIFTNNGEKKNVEKYEIIKFEYNSLVFE
jgi:FkbM family methyltransferase